MTAELQSNQLYMNLRPTFSVWYLDVDNTAIVRNDIVNEFILSLR